MRTRVRVRVRVRVCGCGCARVRVRVCMRLRLRVCVCVCLAEAPRHFVCGRLGAELYMGLGVAGDGCGVVHGRTCVWCYGKATFGVMGRPQISPHNIGDLAVRGAMGIW